MRRSYWAIMVVGLLSALGVGFLGQQAGPFLEEHSAFDFAETAVVLAGGDPYMRRVLGGRDLYRQGRVAAILVSPEPVDPRVAAEVDQFRFMDPNARTRDLLLASGVHADRFAFLPESESTLMEAKRVRQFYQGQPPRRLAVVTSPLHTRRACFIFRQVLPDTEIACVPTPYESNPWWSERSYGLRVLLEYAKLVGNSVELLLGRGRS